MKWPTMDEVNSADRLQICSWYRHLPTANNDSEMEIINRIFDCWVEMGGMTPEISKQIGW